MPYHTRFDPIPGMIDASATAGSLFSPFSSTSTPVPSSSSSSSSSASVPASSWLAVARGVALMGLGAAAWLVETLLKELVLLFLGE